jgi:hypothetical protein
MATSYPALAKPSAAARPIPELPPVITTIFFIIGSFPLCQTLSSDDVLHIDATHGAARPVIPGRGKIRFNRGAAWVFWL